MLCPGMSALAAAKRPFSWRITMRRSSQRTRVRSKSSMHAVQHPNITYALVNPQMAEQHVNPFVEDGSPQIQYIREGYQTIPFPFAPVVSSKLSTTTGPFPFECAKEATLVEFMAHLRSWSAVQKAIDSGRDVWSNRQQKLFTDAWGDSTRRTVKWTLHTVIGTV